jgi:hypothetical protein
MIKKLPLRVWRPVIKTVCEYNGADDKPILKIRQQIIKKLSLKILEPLIRKHDNKLSLRIWKPMINSLGIHENR